MHRNAPPPRRTRGRDQKRRSAYHPNSRSAKLPRQLPLEWRSGELPRIFLAKPTLHPNIFRKRILRMEGNPQIGDYVQVYCPVTRDSADDCPPPQNSASNAVAASVGEDHRLLGYGWYNPKSEIAVRIVRWASELPKPDQPQLELPDLEFWDQLLQRAVSLRTSNLNLGSDIDCYRVLHAEADGFPGLVVDRYADCLSAEVFSAAIAPRTHQVLDMLSSKLGTRHWLMQPGPHLQSQEGFEIPAVTSPQLPDQLTVQEHGVQFTVRFEGSHKTGFFCDQRENRRRLAEFCAGRTVLDLCCYTGGFAITAAKTGGAANVTAVDLDAAPLAIAKRNAGLNQVQVKFTQADAFPFMRDMLRQDRKFDVVVLDPPKLIRNRAELDAGTRKHFDLNRLAMQLVQPGGILLTCSCAGLLPSQEFTRLVRAAARSAFQPSEWNPHPVPRFPQILATTGAAACHPVSVNCPETEYLKAIWMRL